LARAPAGRPFQWPRVHDLFGSETLWPSRFEHLSAKHFLSAFRSRLSRALLLGLDTFAWREMRRAEYTLIIGFRTEDSLGKYHGASPNIIWIRSLLLQFHISSSSRGNHQYVSVWALVGKRQTVRECNSVGVEAHAGAGRAIGGFTKTSASGPPSHSK
jgi:hypothetical protein